MAREFLIVSESFFLFPAQAGSRPSRFPNLLKQGIKIRGTFPVRQNTKICRTPTANPPFNTIFSASRLEQLLAEGTSQAYFSRAKKDLCQLRVRGDKAIEKFTIALTKNQSFIRTTNNREIVLQYEVKVSTSYMYLKMIASVCAVLFGVELGQFRRTLSSKHHSESYDVSNRLVGTDLRWYVPMFQLLTYKPFFVVTLRKISSVER
jgi:hypothetical protein